MKKSLFLLVLVSCFAIAAFEGCKKKDKTEDPTTTTPSSTDKKYALVIDNGAQSMEVGQTVALKAHLVSSTGSVIEPTGVTWSSNISGISGSTFVSSAEAIGIISASVVYEGVTYTASVPLSVQPLASTLLFGVVPSAIIWSTNSGNIQLNTVYIGTQSSSYAFESSDASVAEVSSTGSVSFKKVGNTNIKVTATIGGQKSIITVPVMVVGVPEVPLPVTRVVVNPSFGELFRGETLQLNAKAYNSNGDDVTSTVTFNYVVVQKEEEDEEPSIPISVDATGKLTAVSVGDAYVKVTASGIMGQAEIVVNPDTIITVNPFMVSFGTDYTVFPPAQGPSDQVFTAKMQKVDRPKYRAKNPAFLIDLPNPANLIWALPLTGIPAIDDQFKVVTLSNPTNTSVKVTPIQGKIGSTFLVASSGAYGGAASIMVNP